MTSGISSPAEEGCNREDIAISYVTSTLLVCAKYDKNFVLKSGFQNMS
jgi:hypothetical protein